MFGDMGIVLYVTICALSATVPPGPEVCKEVNYPTTFRDTAQCEAMSVIELAQLAAGLPGYRIDRWKCVRMSSEKEA